MNSAHRVYEAWRHAFPKSGVHLEKLRALPRPAGTHPRRRVPRGPAQRPPAPRNPVPPVLAGELGRVFDLADKEGYFKDYMRRTGLKYDPTTSTNRKALRRAMEGACEELLAGQYPHVKVRVWWEWKKSGAVLGGARWVFRIGYDLREVPHGPQR